MGNLAEKRTNAVARTRADRARAILEVIPFVDDPGFTRILDTLVERAWKRSIEARATPEFLALAFVPKIRAGFSTYCALGLSAIACSRKRSRALTVASSLAGMLGFGERGSVACARRALPSFYRLAVPQELDLVAVASAFILLIDEIFDDQLGHESGEERVRCVERVVRGAGDTSSPAGQIAARLVSALSSSNPAAWPHMGARLVEWADAEVRLERADPSVEPRKAGIEVSMELLAFGASAYVGDRELLWMQDIARLGQMVDDVLDIEKDLEVGRVTLGATGVWDVGTVDALYRRLIDETRALIEDSGEKNPVTRALYERTFRAQLRHMAQVLVDNP